MKKFIVLSLVLLLALTAFVACGDKAPSTTSPTPDSSDPAPESSPAVSPAPASSSTTEAPTTTAVTTTLEDIKAKGSFIVGLDDTFAPMGFREDDNTLVGFDIDLANAVGEYLGITVQFQPIAWDSKEMELSTGKIDCIWNGLSVTPERVEILSLTKPYLANNIIVMTNTGVTIASKEDLANYNIGIQSGSAALEAVTADPVFDSISGKITEYPTYDEVVLDLQTGRLDCMVIDQVFGEYKNTQLGGIYGTADFDFGEDLYAVGLRKGDTALTESLNEALAALNENGTAATISTKWFGSDIVLK